MLGNPEKFSLVESGILGFGIRNIARGIRNPSSTDKQTGSHKARPGIQNPRLVRIPLHDLNYRGRGWCRDIQRDIISNY